jgi:hypothetical protein
MFVPCLKVIGHGNPDNILESPSISAGSRDIVVGIATSYGLDDRRPGVLVPVWSRILQTTVWSVAHVHNRLHLHAYEVQIVQALKPDVKPRRSQFANDIWSNVDADKNYFRRWISVIK